MIVRKCPVLPVAKSYKNPVNAASSNTKSRAPSNYVRAPTRRVTHGKVLMRISSFSMTALGLCLCAALPFTAEGKNKQLEEDLKAQYKLTKTGIDRLRITEPGTIFVIQKEGVYANPSIDYGNVTDKVVDGNVQGPKGFGAAFFSNQNDRSLKVGTTVYVTRIDVRNEDVRFDIITCDTSDVNVKGNTRNVRFSATLAFEFSGAFLEGADAKAVKKAVDAVLLPQSEAQAVQTKTVEIGQTPDQVKSILGPPEKIVNLGSKEIFVYKDMKVIFTDGKVSDVQ